MQKNNRVVKSVIILSLVFGSMAFVVGVAAYTEYTQQTVYKKALEPAFIQVKKFIIEQKQVAEDIKKAEQIAEQKKRQQQAEIEKQARERLEEVKKQRTVQQQVPVKTNYQNTSNSYKAPTVYPTLDKSKNGYEDAYEQRVKQMQEEADKRYEKALEEQQKWAEEQRKASKERMDAYKAESQKNLEEWKKEHGF